MKEINEKRKKKLERGVTNEEKIEEISKIKRKKERKKEIEGKYKEMKLGGNKRGITEKIRKTGEKERKKKKRKGKKRKQKRGKERKIKEKTTDEKEENKKGEKKGK